MKLESINNFLLLGALLLSYGMFIYLDDWNLLKWINFFVSSFFSVLILLKMDGVKKT